MFLDKFRVILGFSDRHCPATCKSGGTANNLFGTVSKTQTFVDQEILAMQSKYELFHQKLVFEGVIRVKMSFCLNDPADLKK